MGLFNPFRRTAPAIERGVRHTQVEQLERRELLAADVLLGGVYFEEATGDDSQPDIIQVSFEGGAAGTVLNRLVISGDKFGDGLSSGDTFFDTAAGGLGTFDAVGFSLISSDGFVVESVSVADGSTDIVFTFSGFEAGEKLVFSIDVDEAQAVNPSTGAVVLQNSLVEGGEFELNTLTGDFTAPGFVDLTLGGVFYDAFDDERAAAEAATSLELALPDDRYDSGGSKIDRTAGAVAHVAQVPLATISGYVYHDRSDDGVFDRAAGEEPIGGVQIELLDAAGAGTGVFTTTNADGYYEFRDLVAGTYGVRESVQPSPYLDGKDTAGSHGGVAGNDIITGAVLDWGDDGLEYNFGELLAGSIAGRVIASNSDDCDFDNPEIVLSGVVIELLDASGKLITTTTTGADGRYKFEGLAPGEYQVREIQPTSYQGRTLFDGGERVGTAGGVLSNDHVGAISIGSDEHATEYDFCEHLGATLSGFVYHDKSDDGVFDPSEDPIDGVELKLLKDGVDTGRRAVTNANGFYQFTNLAPGKYTVMEAQPAGWYDGKDTPGTLGGDASANDMIAEIMLTYGDNSEDNNFGELLGGSIAGRVHASTGPDCDFDDPEILLSGVVIELLDAEGKVIATTITDADGRYKFDDLRPGEYQVREVQPTGYYDGDEHVGTAGGVLSNDLISAIVIGSDEHATRYDFCEHVGANLSGYVYHDQSDDGVFDPTEDPISGVTIKLVSAAGATLATTTTNAGGYYEFTNLAPGKYTVMEVQPAGWYDGKDTPGTLGGDASANDMIAEIMLDFGDNSEENNFGELLGGSIAGRVHASTGPDCDFDNPEILLSGVVIELLNADGDVIDTTTTGADGRYKFTGLAPGEYQVREIQPADYFDGDEHVGSAGGVATDDLISGIVLGDVRDAVEYDFCEHVGAALSGFVYHDASDDGVFDPSEDPIAGVELKLLKGGVDTGLRVTTDANGYYEFVGLDAGAYTVMETQPAGWLDGKDTPGTHGGDASVNDMIQSIVLTYGDHSQENNFGELLAASIAGRVHASNGPDCDFDNPEVLLAGVTIELLNADGVVIATTTTDANGEYKFDGLAPGEYQVREVQPASYNGRALFDGGERAGLPDALEPTNFVSLAGVLNPATYLNDGTIPAIEFTAAGPGGSSVLVSIEFELQSFTADNAVYRWSASGNPADPELNVVGSGVLTFDSIGDLINSSTGTIEIDGPVAGSTAVQLNFGSMHALGVTDANGNLINTARLNAIRPLAPVAIADDHISGIVLTSGETAKGYDFCEHFGAMLSGYVYHDRDDDGARDPGEEPISGVTVKLLKDGVDTGLRSVTDATGLYKFNDLGPGKYTVMEQQPAGWYDGKDTPGTLGGDASTDDMIAMIMLTYGDNSEENNFGELLGGSIAGRVHAEADGDCEYEEGEELLAGVVIELLNESGQVVATTTTNAAGEYAFTNLRPGSYSVRETQPTGYFNGGADVGNGGGSMLGLDLLGDIIVGSDQHWVDYNFCEMLPAQLSGYVFIDGAPIPSLDELTPQQIAELRDGTRTSDDTPLAGVVLELRNGISGDPIFGEEALPGLYPDGPITTTTDANGYYEFTGLPGGVYAVVERQPTDLVDGIDTPGTLGGFAVNAPVPAQGQVFPFGVENTINQFRTRFGNDALVRITLRIGENSLENNFSEVTRQPFVVPPPETPPPPTPPVFAPPLSLLPSQLPPLLAPPETPAPQYGGGSRALGWTWHLSVVNAGWPRELRTSNVVMRQASTTLDASEWEREALDRAEWLLMDDDDRDLESRRFLFGNDEGIPVVGDWDGDGDDDLGVFIAGYWYLDLNGNGRWDRGDLWAHLGSESDLPVTGDWDGDGKTDIGIFGPAWPRDPHAIAREPGLPDAENYPTRIVDVMGTPLSKNLPPKPEDATSGARLLKKTIHDAGRADLIDHVFHYGTPGDTPIAGDWNGDGIRTIGVYRDGAWQLDTNGDGRLSDNDESYAFGEAGDLPAVGDWNGDGKDDLGVYRAGQWLVDSNGNHELDALDTVFELGGEGDQPIAGDWDGDGVDEPAVYSPTEAAPEVRVSQAG